MWLYGGIAFNYLLPSLTSKGTFLLKQFSAYIFSLGLFFLAHVMTEWTQDSPVHPLISAYWLKGTQFT